MKKIATLLLCILLVGLLAVPAFAADTTVFTITPDKSTVAPGETVTFTVTVNGTTPCKSLGIMLSYDKNVFGDITGTCTMSGLVHVFNPSNGFAIMFQNPTAPSGTVGTFSLTAKDGICPSTVSVTGTPSVMNGSETIPSTVSGTSVSISGVHAWDDGKVTVEATCTSEGTTTFTCSKCGEIKTTSIAATGHSHDDGVVTQEPTCSVAGVKTFTCSKCGDTYTEEISMVPHTEGAGVVTTQPTCTEAGVKTYSCTVCGTSIKTEEVPATGHTEGEGVVTTQPTCTTAGVKTYKCTVCDETTKTEEVPATGHAYDNGVVTTEPSCEEDGVKTFTCQNDKAHTKTEIIARTGHSYDNGVVTTEPGCETKGVMTFTCQNDKTHTYTKDIDPIGHDYDDGVITTEPGCETKGVKTFTCRNDASHTYTEEVAAKGHTAGAEMEVTKEPTCTEAGVMSGKCAACGEILKDEAIPALGHKYVEDTEQYVAPTCTEKGSKVFVCENDPTHVYTEEVPATGHSYGDWLKNDNDTHKQTCSECGDVATESHKWNSGMVTKQPTCAEKGEKTFTCTVVSCSHTKTEEIPMTEHEYDKAHTDNEDGKTHDSECECGAVKENVEHKLKEVVIKASTTTVKGTAKKVCEDCGYESEEYELPLKSDDLDDVPKTGDITNQLVLTASAMIAMMAAFCAVVLKRKFVK